ncbi:hypothetical protein RJ640_008037 [Escallonia rubra]|uniref:Protein BIG GRAIN 1-like E n=1 Tax=Escallonia rubra TaxID=112253 RepID=A0AA88QTR2_9ASTE|nr:hypothetical protein RJ640_008037 [Escallonia rubra]
MSLTGLLPDTEKIHNKPLHGRHDSGELDVFEAARYFSGANEVTGHNHGTIFTQKTMREERQQTWRSGGRISIDMPMRSAISSQTQVMEKQIMKEKKYKQPSSPGGRLASFLNSLFNQTSSKKKKSKSSTTQSMKDEDESISGRRKLRRSSISHLSHHESKSMYNLSTASSGFRTPPSYAYTPTKTYKDFRSYSDHKPVGATLSKQNNGHVTKSPSLQNEVRSTEYAWLDEKFKLSNGITEKHKNFGTGFSEKSKDFRKFSVADDDDGADSDSSSDLFELQNYDLSCYSSGLPVYETTHMDTIKRGAPISNGPI